MRVDEVVYTKCKLCGGKIGKGGRDHRFGICDKHVNEQQLYELNLKQALAAGLIGASGVAGNIGQDIPTAPPRPPQVAQFAKFTPKPEEVKQQDPQKVQLAQTIAKRYAVDDEFANEIVELAYKYERPVFPKAKDILAVIGVESSFNPAAKSQLSKDPARGLMQVRAGVWNIPEEELEDIENQIRHGSNILYQYYRKLGDKQKALHAYNIGITSFLQGQENPEYVDKFSKELALYNKKKI